jgi:NTE family protein
MSRHALVLGAGGDSGTAWLGGILAGFADAGIARLEVDTIMGTSGGCIVAGIVASGAPLDTCYRDELRQRAEPPASVPPSGRSVEELANQLTQAVAGLTDAGEMRRRVGRLARAEPTGAMADYRRRIRSYLPFADWPQRRFATVAIDTMTGEPRVFDPDCGVDVVTAVAAACAIPTLCPVVDADGRSYMDGGVRSNENLDLLTDVGHVLVISPRGTLCPQPYGGLSLAEEIDLVRRRGARVDVIEPEGFVLDDICEHMLDTDASVALARTGREQGSRVARLAAELMEAGKG